MGNPIGDLRRSRATQLVRDRYNHMAPLFDLVEKGSGERLKHWRSLLWGKVQGNKMLEVGVGTGANFAFYPHGVKMTAIDLSSAMLKRAREKADRMHLEVAIEEMDVQSMSFPDNSFDAVVASLVLCAVPDPLQGLAEMRRVCKPGCKVVFLEHVRSSNPFLGSLMDLFNPFVFWVFGDNLNRRTVDTVAKSGFIVDRVTDLTGIFKLIEARKP